ncbi:MAG: hypothetical protein WA960_18750 [Tunicatimonas sp.]
MKKQKTLHNMVTDAKKLRLIKRITETEDQVLIDQLESVISASNQTRDILASIAGPIRKEFDLEKVKAEQNFQPFKEGEIERLIQEADIQEPIEDLLAMLRA